MNARCWTAPQTGLAVAALLRVAGEGRPSASYALALADRLTAGERDLSSIDVALIIGGIQLLEEDVEAFRAVCD